MKIKKITKEHFSGSVFNLGVKEHHNYVVNGILVHNCYQNSIMEVDHPTDIIEKFKSFFEPMDENQRPFQIAFGGGEPTTHPQFIELMEVSNNMGITPNYTTNGMWAAQRKETRDSILKVTKDICGGVAVSTHPHLKAYWEVATKMYVEENIFTNLHIIIGGKKSIDDFLNIYEKYKGKVKYFVLLPLTAQGRAKESFVDWDYFEKKVEGSPSDIAFGANFYPYLCQSPGRFKVSLYEPELLSAYLSLENMKVYKSSFSSIERFVGSYKRRNEPE